MLSSSEVSNVGDQLKKQVDLIVGYAVPLGKLADHGYDRIAAIEATGQYKDGSDLDETLLVALGENQDVLALNEVTRVFLGPGPSSSSELGKYRDQVAFSKQADAVTKCLNG